MTWLRLTCTPLLLCLLVPATLLLPFCCCCDRIPHIAAQLVALLPHVLHLSAAIVACRTLKPHQCLMLPHQLLGLQLPSCNLDFTQQANSPGDGSWVITPAEDVRMLLLQVL